MNSMDAPRVLHITPAVFHETYGVIGGAERYAFELARSMADFTPTTLVGFGKIGASYREGRLDVRVLDDVHFVRNQRLNPLSPGLLPLIADHDVIHCHQKHVMVASLAALLGRVIGKPVFVNDHGGGGWDISAFVNTDRWFTGELHDSAYSRKLIGHEGRANSHVVYGGVDTEKFSPISPTTRFEDRPAVYVGRLLPHKGIDYLIQGLPDGMRLTVVGRPANTDYLAYLKNLADGKAVTFLLNASDDAILTAYRGALCVVLPSVYTSYDGEYTAVPELLGQTLIEGMSCGVPGITTDVASLPEVIEDGKSGFLVPPNDPASISERLSWLRDHPQIALTMGAAARERVLTRFTWSAVVKHCLRIYGS